MDVIIVQQKSPILFDRAQYPCGLATDIASLTDRLGRFTIDLLKPGSYVVRASAPDFEPGQQRVQVYAQERSRADFMLGGDVVGEIG